MRRAIVCRRPPRLPAAPPHARTFPDIALLPIISGYFEDRARVGRGDVYVFEMDDATVVALDTYSEPTDQLDLISLHIRCGKDRSAEIARLAPRLLRRDPMIEPRRNGNQKNSSSKQ